jgi:ribonuclease BN (tRNA processing enzyme)
MKLTVVGCSGSVPSPDSPASCYLVEAHDGERPWRVLLDLGSGALGPLHRYVDPVAVDAVLLSHLHPDHCLDLCGLYVMLKYAPQGRSPEMTERPKPQVWGPSGTHARMARAYDLPPEPGMRRQLDFQTWRDPEPVRFGPLVAQPFRVNHPVLAYGLRIEDTTTGGVLAYTGDTDACDALAPLCADADVVLADTAFVEGRDTARGVHLTAARAGAAVTKAGGVGMLVLTHIPPWNDADASRAEARTTWDGELDVARPGWTYAL